jgi:hypothetical protein
MLESFLGMVTNQKAVPCHLIVICHVSYQSAEDLGMPQGTPARGLPITVGRQLSPKVARYFNTFIQAKTQGSSKIIETVSNPNTELKVPVPSKIPNQLPLDTGLATIFEAITGKATP